MTVRGSLESVCEREGVWKDVREKRERTKGMCERRLKRRVWPAQRKKQLYEETHQNGDR